MTNLRFVLLLLALSLPPLAALALNVGAVREAHQDLRTGIEAGRLLPCPEGADCVSSEEGDVPSLTFEGDARQALTSLVDFLVTTRGARVLERQPGYARLLFTTAYVKGADELELRVDEEQRRIHARAFARVDITWVESARPLVESVHRAWGPSAPSAAKTND